MAYEQGMSIAYDEVSKTVTVVFRGKKVVLPRRYESQEDGRRAGEQYCRDRGWEE